MGTGLHLLAWLLRVWRWLFRRFVTVAVWRVSPTHSQGNDMKITTQKNGAWTVFEKANGWYLVKLYDAAGNLLDKMRCDDYRDACDYKRSFDKIARNH